MEAEDGHQDARSSAASTRTRTYTSRPSSMSWTGFWEPDALRRRGRDIARCSPGCAHSERFNASASSRPAAMEPGSCASCSRQASRCWRSRRPDQHDRRRRGKNDDLDAQNAAHAAFAGKRTVTPRSRDGMVEALRVLVACRKTAVCGSPHRSADDPEHDRLRT